VHKKKILRLAGKRGGRSFGCPTASHLDGRHH
jgi:hypothetical protein